MQHQYFESVRSVLTCMWFLTCGCEYLWTWRLREVDPDFTSRSS